jgi:hypothetical protein
MVPRNLSKILASTIGAFFLYFGFVSPTFGACRYSSALESMQRELATKYFPEVKDKLPKISACDRIDVGEGILGDFHSDRWAIRIVTEREDFPVRIVVAHELGHAVAFLQGERHHNYRGHGAIWMRVMIRAGFASEAQRTSNLHFHYPGLDRVYIEIAKLENNRGMKVAKSRDQLDVVAMLKERPQWWDWMNKPID